MSNPSDGDAPVTIAQYPSELEAGFVRSLLEASGIECRLVGGATAGFRAETPGMVRVLVHARDAERARELIASQEDTRAD